MLNFIKDPKRKRIIVKENNLLVDNIHYNNVEQLLEILYKYYYNELSKGEDTI